MSKTFKPLDQQQIEDQLLTKLEIARCCKVGARTVEKWVAERRIPYIRVGHRTLRFDKTAVMAAIKRWSVQEVTTKKAAK
jgi:excisionase family DNA binding protein